MSVMDTQKSGFSERERVRRRVHGAVRRNPALSRAGLSEHLFARLFTGLVYPQIWEDPEVDMAALAIRPGDRIVTIASGGCNALSYLLADPGAVEAVDLNPAHIAFNRLKLAALCRLPDHESFYRFFGRADAPENLLSYECFLKPHLDPETSAYWEKRRLSGRRRISIFSRSLYRYGLLGRFIGMGHRVARFYGTDPRGLLSATSLEEQRRFFDEAISPLFDKRAVRWVLRRKSSLFGLGIPPQQYDALAGGEDMAAVLKARLEKLACGFPLAENYFAWQAFGRGYEPAGLGPLPPYLSRTNFETIRARAGRMTVTNASYAEFLAAKPAGSVERFVLLDAQDWMSDGQLHALWHQITRTAAPGARVIFRTAAEESLLPGRVDPALLAHWDYRREESQALHRRDRSSIYGGFHLYVLASPAP
jgi:S-adenosylmethionine-diacylglycerol 3-amino-3-carboxypropyl transferase